MSSSALVCRFVSKRDYCKTSQSNVTKFGGMAAHAGLEENYCLNLGFMF